MKSIISKIALSIIFAFLLNMSANQVWYKSVIESTKDFVFEHRNKFIFGTIITAVVGIAAWAGRKFWKSLESSKEGISKKHMLMTYINVYKPEGEKSEVRSNYSEKFRQRKHIPSNNTQEKKIFVEDTKFTTIFKDLRIWKEVKNKVYDALFKEIKEKNEYIKKMAKPIKEESIEELIEESISGSQSDVNVRITESTERKNTESIELKNKAINDIEEKIVDSFKNFFFKENIFYYHNEYFFLEWNTTQKLLKILNCEELIENNQNQKNFIAQCIKNVFQTYQSWYPEMIKRYIQNKFEVKKQPIEKKEERSTKFSFKNKEKDNLPEDNLPEMIIEVFQIESVEIILKKLFDQEKKIINVNNDSEKSSILNEVSFLFSNLYLNKELIYKIQGSKILWDCMLKKRFFMMLNEDNYFRNFEQKKFDNIKNQNLNDIIKEQKENKYVVRKYINLINAEKKFKKEKKVSLVEE